jgi:GNAT superfamily N-acetyltransferase
VHDGRIEVVVVASVNDLPVLREVPLVGLTVERRLGINGTRLSARVGGDELGFVEVSADMSRGSALSRYAGWADVGNFFVEDAHRRRGVGTWLLAHAAEWLRLGHMDRLLAYASEDEEAFLVFLVRNGFREVTRTRRGWVLPTV